MSICLPVPQLRVYTRQFTRVVNESIKYCSLQGIGSYSVQKGPTDYLFTVSLTLQNVADGSRYRIEDTSDNSEIASGVQSGTGDVVVSGIGYLGSPRTLRIKVRKGTAGPKYLPFETSAVVGASGGSSFISQILDTIA